jgi:trk system potassium uptake protein TrkH
MQLTATLRILGLLLMLLSTTFIPPLVVEAIYRDGYASAFYDPLIITFVIGFLLWLYYRTSKHPLRTQDGFLIVFIFWLTTSIVGMFPLLWTIEPNISFTDAFFESVSGITTTGSTILTGLDSLPHSILYYRQQLQFLGGISIVILAVAILPALGIGGMQLFRNEMTGPVKDDKLTPRVTHTAKAIWVVYLIMTFVCIICFWIAGMTLFDAIGHGFSTVSTGGFSTHDANMAFFTSSAIKVIAIIFMFLGAVNFNLHYLVVKRKQLSFYLKNAEFRGYLKFTIAACIIVWITLGFHSMQTNTAHSTLNAVFEVVSLGTTTGFALSDFAYWPPFLPMFLLFFALIGGCAGSTAGGVKMVRVLLLQKQGAREIHRLIHPRSQMIIKLDDHPISQRVIEAIWGFFAIYCVVFTLLLLLLLIAEEDFLTLYSALIVSISNTGRGLGKVASNFSMLTDYAKWVLSFAMLAGRLEIFTLLVIFSPAFWRR